MSIYKNAFLKALLLDDGNVAGSGGALGDWTQSHFSGDFYAPGDARRPFGMGAMQRRAGTSKKKKKKKKTKGKKKKSTIKEFRNIEPTGDGGQSVDNETMELINIVRDNDSIDTAMYLIKENWDGWGEDLQDRVKKQLERLANADHDFSLRAKLVLQIINSKSQDEEGDVDPNGGWGGLSI